MRGANLLIGAGGALVLIGLAWRAGWLAWFGNLPGDVVSEGERTTVFVPITSMIVVSLLGSIVFDLAARFFRNP